MSSRPGDVAGAADSASANCAICGAEASLTVICRLRQGISVRNCSRCTGKQLHPLPSEEELAQYYANYYLTTSPLSDEDWLIPAHQPILERLVQHAQRYNSGGRLRILDFGFGNGAFIKLAAREGHDAVAADLSTTNCDRLRDSAAQEGLNIEVVDLAASGWSELEEQRFDIITLFQVIEHSTNPAQLLSRLGTLQNPNGIIYIECPNNDAGYVRIKDTLKSIRERSQRTYYRAMKYPEHLNGFNMLSIRQALTHSGFEAEEVHTYHFSDGVHQIESIRWWPPLWRNPQWYRPRIVAGSLVQLTDLLSYRLLGSGGGLAATGRRTG